MKWVNFISIVLIICLSACSTPPAPAATQTPEPTQTPTPQTFRVTFFAFHDFNGNGKRDDVEPILEGIAVTNSSGKCVTDDDGKCENVKTLSGENQFRITDDRNIPLFEKMSHILQSVYEVKTIKEGLKLDISGDSLINIPLAQGFLTKPFSSQSKYKIKNYLDLDKTLCPSGTNPHFCMNIRDWNNGKQTYDDHTGIDYNAKQGTAILAAAPGIVSHVGLVESSGNRGNYVEITCAFHFITYYHHMDQIIVEEGEKVQRGQTIGTVGSTGASSEPHLHFEIKQDGIFIDPYKDLISKSSINYWTKFNDPVSPS